MVERRESFFKGDGGIELYYQSWECPNPVASLVITHGQAEHSDCYNEFAHALAETNIQSLAWDLRGHGRSEIGRAHV